VLVGPDQAAAFWHQWDHVVETAGTSAIAGDIAKGGHGVVLNEVSIPHDPAAASIRQLNGRLRIQDDLQVPRVHDMFLG
jgi:hypothetical protein